MYFDALFVRRADGLPFSGGWTSGGLSFGRNERNSMVAKSKSRSSFSFRFLRLYETTVSNLFQVTIRDHFVLDFCEKNLF